MNLQQFTAGRQASWTALHDLVEQAGGKAATLGPGRFLEAGRLYRGAAADLAYARRRFPGDPVTLHLEHLVKRAHGLVYSNVTDRQGLWWFVSRGYWRRVRERPLALWLSIALVVLPAVGLGVWAHQYPVEGARVIPQVGAAAAQPAPDPDKHLTVASSTGMATMIFTNNIRVALLTFAGGITAGLLSGWLLLFNGALIGLFAGTEVALGNGSVFFQLVVPHGLLELSLVAVAGAAGFRLAGALLRPGRRRRADALVEEGRGAVEMALGTALWLVPCGIVEGFVTPAGLGLPAALCIGFGLFATFWSLVWFRGRPDPPDTDAASAQAPAPPGQRRARALSLR